MSGGEYRIESWSGREGNAEGIDIIKIPEDAEFVEVSYDTDGKGRVTAEARYLVPTD